MIIFHQYNSILTYQNTKKPQTKTKNKPIKIIATLKKTGTDKMYIHTSLSHKTLKYTSNQNAHILTQKECHES